ncbi:MAG: FAD-binding oxidoreductase [Deltaproteobacteria bacterium]|nr:FAD-binding oxidoreductase [Deltaproteobacteria bacterium]
MANEIEKQLQSVLASGEFSNRPDVIAEFNINNPLIKTGTSPQMVLRPKNREKLQELIRATNESGLNLTVASSSGMHCKGGFSSETENLLIDLSPWNKIEWINRRNRVCMIEPGVTYGELLEALDPLGMTISMPLAPRNGKSVVAAVTDREPSTWPNRQWDISDPVASTEFIFGNGELFRTGAAGGPGSLEKQRAAGGAQKGPLGPSQADFHRVIQGSQGTMGIVTWITLRTELKPSVREPFLIGAKKIQKLVPFVYDVQRPWLGEHSFIMNRTALAMLMTCGNTSNFSSVLNALPDYVCLQNIAGFERLPEERVQYQKNDITKIAKSHGLKMTPSLKNVSAEDVLSAATSPCGDIDFRHQLKGHCLSVFFLSTLDRAGEFIRMITDLAGDDGIDEKDIGIYIQPVVQNHACHIEFMIPFDPENGTNVSLLKELENKAVKMLLEQGVFFSRPYGSAGDLVFDKNPLNTEILKKVKDIFDPNRVLNKGKWKL